MAKNRMYFILASIIFILSGTGGTAIEQQITDNTADQSYPAIDGTKIVWMDSRNGAPDIYMYDISTSIETRITTDPSTQEIPDISGNYIVWNDYRNGKSDIYMYDISTGIETRITNNDSDQNEPDIDGNRIVWVDWRYGNPEIYMYDISTGTETRITYDPAYQLHPAISGNRIVYYDHRHGNPEIYMYDISTGLEKRITNEGNAQDYPDISGNYIVWMDWRYGNSDLYLYDISTNTENRLTDQGSIKNFPKIDGNRIVWADYYGGISDIHAYEISTNSFSVITNDPASQFDPDISGDRIVWADSRNNNYDIYLNAPGYTISVSTSPTNLVPQPTGGGQYISGATVTVVAQLVGGYTFQKWTENGNEVSTSTSYQFLVSGDRNLVAEYVQNQQSAISVDSPNGGENWVRGTYKTIRWSADNNIGRYVKIELYKGDTLYRIITSRTVNDGSYNWFISPNIEIADNYKIKVTSTSNSAYTDQSDNYFTISGGSITVKSPNGGENWKKGSMHTVKWTKSGDIGKYVKIELLKGGSLDRVIIDNVANYGFYNWRILPEQVVGTDYQVKISSTSNPIYTDTSDGDFRIY